MRYSKEEIRLCKEIYRYYKRPSEYRNPFYLSEDDEQIIPLWTWRGARSWLKERGYAVYVLAEHPDFMYLSVKKTRCIEKDGDGVKHYKFDSATEIVRRGKTDLEAILKVVLAVLREEGC